MGCGLKSNPVSLNANPDYQQTVKNLIAVSADDSITLKWDFYDKSGLINNINIEKSEVGSAGNECKDCPRTFGRIGQIPVKESVPEGKKIKTFYFTDNKVEQGKTYNYRLMLCDDGGLCREASRVEANFNGGKI
jgi:hypothetical protein